MNSEMVLGVLIVAIGGIIMGGGAWPMKLMKTFQFEHWWFWAMLFGLILFPWGISLVAFPNILKVYCDVPSSALIRSALFALIWGVANLLCGLCYVRIGMGLTQAILSGLGVSVGVTLPMILKGSGQFHDSPDLFSAAGQVVLTGVGVMLAGVILAALAGFGRDRELKRLQKTSGNFMGGLIMCAIAGVASAGFWLSYIYCQGPVVSRISILEAGRSMELYVTGNQAISHKYEITQAGTITLTETCDSPKTEKQQPGENEAKIIKSPVAITDLKPISVAGMTAKEAGDKIGDILKLPQKPEDQAYVRVTTENLLSVFPVWSICALSGALLNLLYPAFLMTKKKSWGVLMTNWKEFGLTVIMGLQTILAIGLPAKGMILLGTFGASVGFGIQQAMQMVGGQGVGFVSGEWRGVHDKSRWQMYMAIETLIVAAMIMAFGNTIPK
jgi:hypothetical protein